MRSPVTRFERVAGYFILLAIVVVVVLFLRPGLERFGANPLIIRILADEAHNLKSGDSVTMRGIQIGEVRDLDLLDVRKLSDSDRGSVQLTGDGFRRVLITCQIRRKYSDQVTTDVGFFIVPPAVVGSGSIDVRRTPETAKEGQIVKPLESKVLVQGLKQESIMDAANELVAEAGTILKNVGTTVKEVENNIKLINRLLQEVETGDNTLAKLLRSDELYKALEGVIGTVETKIENLPVDETIVTVREEVLKELRGISSTLQKELVKTNTELVGHLVKVLSQMEKGMEHFPPAAAKLVAILADARKVLESLKRNFLIRGNLPDEGNPRRTAPVSGR
ncbi:MAG: MlaD family protein [Planctomycetota bacterium]